MNALNGAPSRAALRRRRIGRPGVGRAAAAAGLALALGCAPRLVVTHVDPARGLIEVRVDGELLDSVRPDDEVARRIPVGRHHIELRAVDGRSVMQSDLYVEADVFVQLLPGDPDR
jgi:hypothetical protein